MFLWRQARSFENVTLARRRKHFRVFLAIFLVAELLPTKEAFQYTRILLLLVKGIVTASSHAL